MVDKYEVVTLCGSTKFKDDFVKAQEFFNINWMYCYFGWLVWSCR